MLKRAVLLVAILCAAPAWCDDGLTAAETVDFDTDVMPVFTKFGCNSGACHGAAVGRGSFKLSLFGSRPADDYAAITSHLEGRRVNVVDADKSLILLKPTDLVTHEGGERFPATSAPASVLRTWIQNGARRDGHRSATDWTVATSPPIVRGSTARATLTSHATFATGERREVTAWTLFTADDPDSVRITDDGQVEILRPGRHVIVARYLSRVAPVELIVPFSTTSTADADYTAAPESTVGGSHVSRIDALIDRRLAELNLTPGPPATDAAFRRRAWLDLTGRLPPSELEPASSTVPLDRDRLVDELIASEAFVEFWTFRIMRWLELDTLRDIATAQSVRAWLMSQLQADASWNAVVTSLVLTDGAPTDHPPSAFHLVRSDARLQAEHVSEALAGIRLRCANCHDHPLDRWTQNDYHGLAAVFAGLERAPEVRFTGRGTVIHPATGLPAVPQIPGGPPLATRGDARQQVVDWLLESDSQVLARNTVNRVWKSLMGRGLCDPVDDLRPTNPSAHADVLSQLSSEFVQSGYSLRELIRTICRTQSYGRGSQSDAARSVATEFYAFAHRKTLEPEVLLDAVCDVTDVPERFGDHPPGTRAIHLASIGEGSPSLTLLRNCRAADSRCAVADSRAGIDTPQYLSLLNGPVLNDRLRDPRGLLERLHREHMPVDRRITTLFQRTLGRAATQTELDFWLAAAATNDDAARRAVLEDLLWSLLVCDEFLTIR